MPTCPQLSCLATSSATSSLFLFLVFVSSWWLSGVCIKTTSSLGRCVGSVSSLMTMAPRAAVGCAWLLMLLLVALPTPGTSHSVPCPSPPLSKTPRRPFLFVSFFLSCLFLSPCLFLTLFLSLSFCLCVSVSFFLSLSFFLPLPIFLSFIFSVSPSFLLVCASLSLSGFLSLSFFCLRSYALFLLLFSSSFFLDYEFILSLIRDVSFSISASLQPFFFFISLLLLLPSLSILLFMWLGLRPLAFS